jgi:hypothetical protein
MNSRICHCRRPVHGHREAERYPGRSARVRARARAAQRRERPARGPGVARGALRIARAQPGQPGERRMSRRQSAFVPQGQRPAADGDIRPAGAYAAAACSRVEAARGTDESLHATAGPGRRRHGTSAPLSVRKTDAALSLREDLRAIGCFRPATCWLQGRPGQSLAPGTSAALWPSRRSPGIVTRRTLPCRACRPAVRPAFPQAPVPRRLPRQCREPAAFVCGTAGGPWSSDPCTT